MDSTSFELGRQLFKRIGEQQAARLPVLIAGDCADFAAYKFQAGYLTGLNDVIRWLEEINLADDERGSPFARAS